MHQRLPLYTCVYESDLIDSKSIICSLKIGSVEIQLESIAWCPNLGLVVIQVSSVSERNDIVYYLSALASFDWGPGWTIDVKTMLLQPNVHIWAISWDSGTYHIGDQRRLRRACASAQTRQSLRCSHTWSMEVDESLTKNQTSRPTGWLCMCV